MQYDSFKGLATLRSLAYPGFTFVYSVRVASQCEWVRAAAFGQLMWNSHCLSCPPGVLTPCEPAQTELKEYDSLYLGTGEANKDMMFMIA
jgi:hypothetical protein